MSTTSQKCAADPGGLAFKAHSLLYHLDNLLVRIIDNLLVRILFIIVMIRWTGLAPWEYLDAEEGELGREEDTPI